MENNMTQPETNTHPRAHIWMVITIIIVIVGVVSIIFYVVKAQKLSRSPSAKQSQITSFPVVPSATPTAASQALVVSQDTAPKKVAAEIKKINVAELKKSIEDLKTSLAVLNQ